VAPAGGADRSTARSMWCSCNQGKSKSSVDRRLNYVKRGVNRSLGREHGDTHAMVPRPSSRMLFIV
jgi:hypothetical protein